LRRRLDVEVFGPLEIIQHLFKLNKLESNAKIGVILSEFISQSNNSDYTNPFLGYVVSKRILEIFSNILESQLPKTTICRFYPGAFSPGIWQRSDPRLASYFSEHHDTTSPVQICELIMAELYAT